MMIPSACPYCHTLLSDQDYRTCPTCGASRSDRAPNFTHRESTEKHRSLYGVFPPVFKNVWVADDSAFEYLFGETIDGIQTVDEPGDVLRGPHIDLDIGMCGIEYQISLADNRDHAPETIIAQAQVTAFGGRLRLAEMPIRVGQVSRQFGGMYHGARLNVVIDRFADDVEFRLISMGECPFELHGFKLIPRPGFVWFPSTLDHSSDHWRINPDRSGVTLKLTEANSPRTILTAEEYRVGIKFTAPSDLTSGDIAIIDAVGRPLTSEDDSPLITLAEACTITTEEVRARFGIPDSKLRFRIDEPYKDVQLRVKALVEGLTLQWVRMATADESLWQHYYNLGGLESVLGPPMSGFFPDPAMFATMQGRVRHFEGGSIYWTIEHGPCQIIGAIGECFEAMGGTSGVLGFPITRPQAITSSFGSEGMIQYFERDTIRSAIIQHGDGSAIPIYGDIAAQYLIEETSARFGFPLSSIGNDGTMQFEGGSLA